MAAKKQKLKSSAPVDDVEDNDLDLGEESSKVYTYVGGGEQSPHKINFMGLQQFKRGEATEVTNERILAKIANNPSFLKGEVDQDSISEYDEQATKEADEQRAKDKKLDESIKKTYAKLASKNEEK